ncbi:MAG: gluconate 2-dehydrogenase subunit 3 family protein [Rhodothermales bacterium]
MNRRETLKMMAAAPVAAGFSWTQHDVDLARENMDKAAQGMENFEPEFFTAHELKTVNVLCDLIIPADDRSGSATDAGVPAFMDFMMMDRPTLQLPMRGGLAWMDTQSRKLFSKPFIECTETQQKELLDQIAYPDIAAPDMSQGVSFFNSFRDFTASGFWSSKVGVEDLKYIGNTFVPEWKGCPTEVLDHLGVSYDD